ncbi:MAG TPA: ATPase, T2SS/T4P/T4SS family, partial [Armatimonadota bacterium]|nr:ATPase, T2SS/T4P/T4SS family [Armatimonadota bacterium]
MGNIDWEREQAVLRLLHRQKYLTADQARDAYQEGLRGDVSALALALQRGYVTQEQIDEVSGGPPKEVASLHAADIAPEVVSAIPAEMGRRLRAFPVAMQGDTLEVAMSDPDNVAAIDEIRRETGLRVKPLRVGDPEIAWAMDTYWTEDEITDLEERMAGRVEGLSEEVDRIADLSDAPAVVQLASSIVTEGVRRGASDVHIESKRQGLTVRYRVDGMIEHAMDLPDTIKAALISRVKIMSNMDIGENRRPQDGRFTTQAAGRRVDVRSALRPTAFGENIVLRLLDKNRLYITFDQLGMNLSLREQLEGILRASRGLLAIVGGTGSGKTTTLYACLHNLRQRALNIETVEDPIEYQLEGINQATARPDIGAGFAQHVRATMRQDPDVIMVGEARDQETMDVSFRAALTGHLVLTSLHSNDAPAAVTRMLQMGVEPYLVSSALRAVVAQRLVRRVCPDCKVSRDVDDVLAEAPALRKLLTEHRITAVAAGQGCTRCRGTGFSGRTGLFELMRMSPELRTMVLEEVDEEAMRHAAVSEGMVPITADAFSKLRS